jgi:hypothetical protein
MLDNEFTSFAVIHMTVFVNAQSTLTRSRVLQMSDIAFTSTSTSSSHHSSTSNEPVERVVFESFAELWLYPTLWNGIASAAIYTCFGLFASFVWRRRWFALLLPLVAAAVGFVNGFVSGSFTFLPIAAIYEYSDSSMPQEFAVMLGTFFAIFYFVIVVIRWCCAT